MYATVKPFIYFSLFQNIYLLCYSSNNRYQSMKVVVRGTLFSINASASIRTQTSLNHAILGKTTFYAIHLR